MKWIRPSKSFEILLPDSIVHQTDERVSSFWINGEPVLLQLSSYLKTDGKPMSARHRLDERIAASTGKWKLWDNSPVSIEEGTEQAIGETVDSNGLFWIHAYIVWPYLTIYATISGPEHELRNPQLWANTALETIRLNV